MGQAWTAVYRNIPSALETLDAARSALPRLRLQESAAGSPNAWGSREMPLPSIRLDAMLAQSSSMRSILARASSRRNKEANSPTEMNRRQRQRDEDGGYVAATNAKRRRSDCYSQKVGKGQDYCRP